MGSDSDLPSSDHLFDHQYNQMERLSNNISSASGFEQTSLRAPNCLSCALNAIRLDALETRLRALEHGPGGSGYTRTPPLALGMNSIDSRPSQGSGALATAPLYDTIFGDDVATISGPNHGYPSESLASTIGADAYMGIQHDNCQMGATFEHFLNVGPAFGVQDFDVQPNMLSPIEPQGVQAANGILDNAAAFTPPAGPRVPCPVCSRTFGRSRDLRRHVTVKHNPNARAYACPEPGCRYSNLRRDKLQLHRRTCHG